MQLFVGTGSNGAVHGAACPTIYDDRNESMKMGVAPSRTRSDGFGDIGYGVSPGVRHLDLSLIRSRGHHPKGGYDGQNGIKQGGTTDTAAVL